MSIRIVLSTTIVFAVTGGALAQQPPSAADGPWSGQVQCVLSARGPTYQDDQTHTWRITGGPPRLSGMFRQWPAVWSVEGRGGGSIIGGPATWVTSVPETSAPITISEANGQIRIASQHGLLVANGGMTVVNTTTNQRSPASLEEWVFPTIDAAASATTISETRSRPTPSYSRGWRQPSDVVTQETCTWNLTRGGGITPTTTDTGRRGQPPELSRGVAAPPPTTVLPPPPPLTAGGPTTPPPGVATPVGIAPLPTPPVGPANAPPPSAGRAGAADTIGRPGVAPTDAGAGPALAAGGASPGAVGGGPGPNSGAGPGAGGGATSGRANSPVPSGNLASRLGGQIPPPGAPQPVSGTYLVSVTGLVAGQATSDDPLSTDGRGDEIYAAAVVRRYDRRSSQALESASLQTFVYGDTNQAPDRQIAGSMSALGGIKDSDRIPRDMSLARVAAPQEGIFPWRLWQGTLADGVDALIISTSVWESDSSPRLFAPWVQNQNSLTSSLLTRQQVLNQITGRGFGWFNLDPVAGAPVNNQALEIILMVTTGTLGVPVIGQAAGAGYDRFDRPIGLIRNGVESMALANPVVVLTREIIEAALSGPSNVPLPTPTAGLIGVAPKPGIMVLYFVDGDMTNTGERPAAYYMVLQVERLSEAPPAPAGAPGGGAARTAPPPEPAPPPTQTADARPPQVTTTSPAPPIVATTTLNPALLPPVLINPPTTGGATQAPVSNLPTTASALPPGADTTPAGELTAAPIPPSIQDLIGSCTLRGPDDAYVGLPIDRVRLSWATPAGAYLAWPRIDGVTGYRVLRSDLGDLTPTPIEARYNRFSHDATLQPGTEYFYVVVAQYPFGCGATGFLLTPNSGSFTVDARTSPNSPGRVELQWKLTFPTNFSLMDTEVVVVHVDGPGLPSTGVDLPGGRGDGNKFFVLGGIQPIFGLRAGTHTWTLTPYWRVRQETGHIDTNPRVANASLSKTVTVP